MGFAQEFLLGRYLKGDSLFHKIDPRIKLLFLFGFSLTIFLVESKGLFDENWQVFEEGRFGLSEEEKQEIEEIYQAHDKAFCRRCDYCQPCTEEIPIQIVMTLPSMVKRVGKNIMNIAWAKEAYENAGNCSECGECMTRCPYDLPIPDLLKEKIAQVEKLLEAP